MNAQLISAVADVMEANARLLRTLGAPGGALNPARVEPPVDTRSWWKLQQEQAAASETAKHGLLADAIHEAAQAGPSTDEDTTVAEDVAVAIADRIAPVIVKEPAAPGFRVLGSVTVGEFTFKTTGRFAKIIDALLDGPKTAAELVEIGVGKKNDVIRPYIGQTNRILKDATKGQWFIKALPGRHLGAFGKEGGRWGLIEAGLDTAGEARVAEVAIPVPEPVAEPIPEPRAPAPVVPVAELPKPAVAVVSKAKHEHPPIPDGHLCAVDLDLGLVATAGGTYALEGATKMGRTLRLLATGDMFDLKVVAQKSGWRDAETARTAMLMEQRRLSGFGLGFYIDKINARLRRIEA